MVMEQTRQNCGTGESLHCDQQHENEKAIGIDRQSLFNGSFSSESVSDISEEKEGESVPQDLSMVTHRENQN